MFVLKRSNYRFGTKTLSETSWPLYPGLTDSRPNITDAELFYRDRVVKSLPNRQRPPRVELPSNPGS
jgi:hypothetical protein